MKKLLLLALTLISLNVSAGSCYNNGYGSVTCSDGSSSYSNGYGTTIYNNGASSYNNGYGTTTFTTPSTANNYAQQYAPKQTCRANSYGVVSCY